MGLLSRGPTVSNEIFRKLTEADMDACLDLAVSRDWLPEAKKWQLLFDAGDVYGIQDNRDGIIATLASTIYPPGISAMSMMLVAKHREREGLGTKLMNYVIDATGDIPAFLAATPCTKELDLERPVLPTYTWDIQMMFPPPRSQSCLRLIPTTYHLLAPWIWTPWA
jgi:GNAT superfamily N-acetyltransferase